MTTNYNELVQELLVDAPLNELGPGTPDRGKHALLAKLSPQSVVEPHVSRDPEVAACCCAGLWLRYNYLHESHEYSQAIETSDGSYWHAIMHRREADFGNAKYWFRRVGDHAVFDALSTQAAKLTDGYDLPPEAAFLSAGGTWDPMRFVDLCSQQINTGTPIEILLREIQRREWDLLFDFCYRRAASV